MDTSAILNSLSSDANGEVSTENNTELAQVSEEQSVEEVSAEVEPEIEVKKEEPKEDLLFSKRFAALSKKEKAIRQRESELNSKMAALEERMKSLEPKKVEEPVRESLEQRIKRDPLKALEEAGLSYEKLTQLVLNDGKISTESQMQLMREELDNKYKSEIENLRKEIESKEVKKQQEHEKQVVENFKIELAQFVDTGEEYELIKANNAVDTVYQVIEEHYKKSGRVLSNKEAADAVESHLLEEARKLLKLKKLMKQEVVEPPKKPEVKVNAPSLSNSHAAMLSKGSGKKLISDDESKMQAASIIRWDD